MSIKRTSCGYCTTTGSHRHRDCPGTLSTASAGKPWTCWCFESGHPDVIPVAPAKGVPEDDTEPSEAPRFDPAHDDAMKAERERKAPREKAERCGAPTKNGPCKRRAGHTAGHDAR